MLRYVHRSSRLAAAARPLVRMPTRASLAHGSSRSTTLFGSTSVRSRSSPIPTHSLLVRSLCSGGGGGTDGNTTWDPLSAVHGAPKAAEPSEADAQQASADDSASKQASASGAGGQGERTKASARRPPGSSGAITPNDKADLLRFQAYVRQRLAEIAGRLPSRPGTREQTELAFLEDEVVQDHMSKRKRRIRDPLRGVTDAEISHNNLPLLSRFVSEAGAILPRKLTGVTPTKQKRLAAAIKRAHHLALMPTTWKLPRYRHASYADQYSQPERNLPPRAEDDEFRDPPDIRFPNQWEKKRSSAFAQDLVRSVRATAGVAPRNRPAATRKK